VAVFCGWRPLSNAVLRQHGFLFPSGLAATNAAGFNRRMRKTAFRGVEGPGRNPRTPPDMKSDPHRIPPALRRNSVRYPFLCLIQLDIGRTGQLGPVKPLPERADEWAEAAIADGRAPFANLGRGPAPPGRETADASDGMAGFATCLGLTPGTRNEELLAASRGGDLAAVRQLIEKGRR